jgi:hypothetical protein
VSDPSRFTAELADQSDPEIGWELIRVRFDDGRVQELRLHDYEELYALPGVYEQIVHERLGCRSPAELASMLADAVDELGWNRRDVCVLDIAAGNGVSGEALAGAGLGERCRYGTDIVPAARAAALRDRPTVYDRYLTLDLLRLADTERSQIAAIGANVLSCVAPVGEHGSELPPAALVAAAGLLACDAVVAYMHDPAFGTPDPVTAELWIAGLGRDTRAEQLRRRRYVHRYTVNGEPFEMDGVVWRVRRARPRPQPAARPAARRPACPRARRNR